MLPLLPFAIGLLTGAVAVKFVRSEKAKESLDLAQDRLRQATVKSLSKIEHSSGALRSKLEAGASVVSPAPSDAAETAPVAAENTLAKTGQKSAQKPAARKRPARKPKAPVASEA